MREAKLLSGFMTEAAATEENGTCLPRLLLCTGVRFGPFRMLLLLSSLWWEVVALRITADLYNRFVRDLPCLVLSHAVLLGTPPPLSQSPSFTPSRG